MATVPIEEAEGQLRTLVARAAAGEAVEIGGPGSFRVRLVPVVDEALKDARRRGFGSMRGQFKVPESFFDPLPKTSFDFGTVSETAARPARDTSVAAR